MELRELGDRLLRLHAKLIIVMILAGVLAGLGVFVRQHHQYQANAQLVLGAQDPQNTATAAALSDTARGIATGAQLVGKVISQTGVQRNEAEVANAVIVHPYGSSGVLILTVTDTDPQVAVKLANALAAGVVTTRATLIQNAVASSIRGLGRQEASINAQIRKLNNQISHLTAQNPGLSSQAAAASLASAQLSQMEARLASLQDQATSIAVQQNQLAAQQGPQTKVIDQAVSAVSIPQHGVLYVILGGLLGLVIGIAMAAAREALRPSLVGTAAISRATGVPLLGEMGTAPDSWTLATLPDAGTYIELAADSHHVQEVRFAALDSDRRRGARLRMLEGPLHRLRYDAASPKNLLVAAAHDGPPPGGAPGGAKDVPPAAGPDGETSPRTGLVVAIPRVIRLADVDALTNFVWLSGWALLGVIVYAPSKKRATNPTDGPRPAASQPESSPGGHLEVDA
jgi:capsular polysaccharide biosynthesis protein